MPSHSSALSRLWSLLLIVLLLGAPQAARAQDVGGTTEAAIAADGPQFLRDVIGQEVKSTDGWTIGGGYLYWWACDAIIGSVDEAAPQTSGLLGYLKRWPIRGGSVTTISNAPFCDSAYKGMVADDSGLYYFEPATTSLIRRSTADPLKAVVVEKARDVIGDLVLDDTWIYWLEQYNATTYKWRTRKNAIWSDDERYEGPIEPLGYGGANGNYLTVLGGNLYWYAGSRIYRQDKTCNGDTCTGTELAIEYGTYIAPYSLGSVVSFNNTSPLWLDGPLTAGYTGADIRGYSCRFISTGISCGAGTVYTAPSRDGGSGTLGQMWSDGTYLFFVENVKKYYPPSVFGGYWGSTDTGQLMKWKLHPRLFDTDPFISPKPIACKDCHGGAYAINGTPRTRGADGWVYFETSNGLARIRADAPPIAWDLTADAMEVTQVIQNLNNDVPLIANKPTYARLYGHLADGPSVFGVNALLYGTRGDGSPLPGSPLRPTNGTRNLLSGVTTFDRSKLADSWLFELPSSWLAAGAIRLSGAVEPRNPRNEVNPGNNARPYIGLNLIKKAPICIVTIPVRSHGPAASNSDPSLFFARDMVRRMYPVSDVWLYHQDDDIAELQARFGIPPWEYGPYEIPDDSWKMLLSLTARDLFSDDPDKCDNANARTHYVGIVSAQTQTGDPDPNFGTNGSGRVGYDQMWFKLPGDNWTSADWKATRAATLPHELGHNYGREHVNCGSPDDPDGGYPYIDSDGTACKLDNRSLTAATTYFGFNGRANEVIAPTAARDLLAYGSNRWVSDYTYRALAGGIATNSVAAATTAAAAEIATANTVIQISGVVTETAGTGELTYGWQFPGAALSGGMMQKWQSVAVPSVAAIAPSDTPPVYTLRLRDGGGALLDERAVTIGENTIHPDEATISHTPSVEPQTFAMAFPGPSGSVARIELTKGGSVIAALAPGTAAPTVAITSPAGGETIDSSMTIAWTANDPNASDKLLATVQYSPDNGASWRAMLTAIPSNSGGAPTSLSLSALSGIPASAGSTGLIRVAVSDGVNTALSTSRAFTVVNRAPQPIITLPVVDQQYAAGASVTLDGAAMDTEDGGLSGTSLAWTLDGGSVGGGERITLDGLAPGLHTARLTATDSAGKAASAETTFLIKPLLVPLASAPTLDGSCDEDAYASAATVTLQPYSDGSAASALLVRTADALWVCFSGMQRGGGSSPGSFVSVRIDANLSRDRTPQTTDYSYSLGEGGVASTASGDGAVYNGAGPGGADGRVSAAGGSWTAELRIDAASFGGFERMAGVMLDHNWVNATGDDRHWPSTAVWNSPATWATTALGTQPTIYLTLVSGK